LFKHAGLIVFLAIALVAVILLLLDLKNSFIIPLLTSSLNIIFRVGAFSVVAFISAKSYLKNGSFQLLLIGSSMVAFAVGALLNVLGSLLAVPEWLNFALSMINISFFVFAALNILAAAILFFKRSIFRPNPTELKLNLLLGYISAVVLIVVLGWMVYAEIIPPFAIGREYTFPRYFTLIGALALFLISTLVIGKVYFESKSKVLYWYALALGLHVVSVSALLLAPGAGTALSWWGSVAQCLGSVFFVIGLLSGFRTPDIVNSWTDAFRRDKRQFTQLFSHMNMGFAYHKMIFDQQGKPVDYVFLEVNDAFEEFTGLKRSDVLNRKVTDVIPGIEKDPADWIGTYGKVVTSGQATKFENYSEFLKRWYLVSAYSPESGYFAVTFIDISERKKAEESLRESEERFRTAMDDMLEGCQIIGHDWRYIYINDTAEAQNRRSRQELIGNRYMDMWPGIESTNVFAVIKQCLEESVARNMENEFTFPDGATGWFDLRIEPIPEGVFILSMDITDRKKTEEALRESEKRLSRSQEIAHLGSWELDLKENRLTWSDEVYRIFGLKPQEFDTSYEAFLAAVHPDDREAVDAAYSGSISEGKDGYEIDHRIIRKDNGEIRFVHEKCTHIRDKSGQIVKSIGMVQDITERKEAEDKLEEYSNNLEALVEDRTKKLESTALYARRLIEASLDPLVTISAEGKITDVNESTELATGCKREELIGSDFSNYFTEPEKARMGYQRVFADGFVKDYPLAIRHKSGKITDVLYNATIYTNEAGEMQGVFAAARDITELKKAEAQAQEAAKKLKDSERLAAIGATAGMVGHDIRNPLQAITSDVYLAKVELASVPDVECKTNALESLTEIEKNISYINKIVQDLQDYARPLSPSAKEVNLQSLIEDLVKKNGVPDEIKVSVKVQKEAASIMADPDIIRRVLANLVTNAVQAMPEGGKLNIRTAKEADDTVITVQDTGVGIPEEARAKLFTPLFTTKSKGQGFGLAVVKRMVEAMNGTITFESKIGEGTKFIVRLPLPQRAKR
jgi:PAS domain S-box-containing protein